MTATCTHWSMALGGKQRCRCCWFSLRWSKLNADSSLLLYGAKGTVAVVVFTDRIFHSCPWVMCVWACVLGEGGSRRRDVRLMRDTVISLVVRQGRGVVVCDEWVLLLLLWRRWWRAAALGELTGQLAELLRVGQRLQHSVLSLQDRVPLVQLLDVLLQYFHLLTNSIHQMAFHQVLKDKKGKTTINTQNNKKEIINCIFKRSPVSSQLFN